MNDSLSTAVVGRSPAIRQLRHEIRRAAPSSLPVVVQGETGAGKELVARFLHELSGRRGRFVATNVCALPEAMFEAALFGHVRGAFTGAVQSLPGYLAEANGGTLLLDEIGGLPLVQQIKLLRAIETQEYRPVGARVDARSQFRVIAATNEPIHNLVAEGRFRADLLYRLSGIVIHVPALSERLEDIPWLAIHFADSVAGGGRVRFSRRAMSSLMDHRWPGNVRELRNVVERVVLLAPGFRVRRQLVESVIAAGRTSSPGDGASSRKAQLFRLLETCGWDTAAVAAELAVSRSTVYRRMERLGIAPGCRRV